MDIFIPSIGRRGSLLKKRTVLITCAGRRVSLLKLFQSAAQTLDGRALAADIDSLAPSLYFADGALRLPRVVASNYISILLELVERENIQLIVPTIDTELPILAKNADVFSARACLLLVSSPRLIAITSDKWLTIRACSEAGIRVPRSWLPEGLDEAELPEELFIKPRDGSASQHTYAVGRGALSAVLPLVPNALIQERLIGQEITVDALLDLDGRPIHYVPRYRLKTVGGESVQGVTIDDHMLKDWLISILEFASAMGGRGPLTLQAFLTEDGPVLSEINARFGGGFPLTHAAGGHYPEWLLRSLNGEALEPSFGNYRRGLFMTRYYNEHFTEDRVWS
jgi:carbamoyl-phosphate synthase large subunit